MKMRKILSFVLVLTLVLGSFSMAFAATPATNGLTDITGNANEDAIQVAYDLGIVTGNPDGTFAPAKAVNRAEFAAMITRALAIPESALTGYSTTKFKDMTGYGWATSYISFCASKGIMLGDGNGNAMPGRTISVNEAITMALRAIGYTSNSANLVGTWPANYVSLAQTKELYSDVAAALTVDKANAAQIIYNTLKVGTVTVNTDGQTNDTGKNLLTTGLNCTEVTNVAIGSDVTYDNALFNITKMLGAVGTAYKVKSGDNKDDYVAFIKDSTVLTGYLDAGKFVVNGTNYEFKTAADATITTFATIVNGKYTAAAAGATIGSIAYDNGDLTINAKVSGKKIETVHNIVAWNVSDALVVKAADIAAIKDGQLLNGDFDLDDNKAIVNNSYELVGATSLSKIVAGDLVYVYNDGATTDQIRKVAVASSVITGKVTEVKTNDYAVVNGVKYYFYATANPFKVAYSSMPKAGDEVKLTVDNAGYVYDFEKTSGKTDSYGLVMTFANEPDSSIDSSRVKLYTSADSEKLFTLAKDSKMTVAAGSTGMTAHSLTAAAIVKYGLNSDGLINSLDVKTLKSATTATLSSVSVIDINGVSMKVASDVVVFTTGTTIGLTKIANVETKAPLAAASGFYYMLNDDNEVAAMVINYANASANADDLYAVVNSATYVADKDDNQVEKIETLVAGVAKSLTALDATTGVAKSPTAQAVKITLDGEGFIKTFDTTTVPTKGTVSAIDSTTIKLGANYYDFATDMVVYQVTLKNDGSVDYYTKSSTSSIRSALNYSAWAYDFDTTKDHEGIEVLLWVKY